MLELFLFDADTLAIILAVMAVMLFGPHLPFSAKLPICPSCLEPKAIGERACEICLSDM
jgi:hypothetical protein